jgi:hypothetical protein
VVLAGNGYPEIQVSNHNSIDPVSNFIIDENTRGTINITGSVINKISSLIVRDGGQLYLLGSGFSEAASHDIELPMDITFEGTGQPNVSGGGVGAGVGAGGGEQTFTVDYEAGESYDSRSRIGVQTNGQSIGVYPFSYYKPVNLELSGEITFADSDLSITTNSDIDISGTISGEGNSVDPRNSVGIVTVSSTTNDSDSSGKLNVRKYTKQTYSGVFNETYTVIASSGQEVVLDDITLRDVVVQSFGKLSGRGGTAALFIAPDGIVAPGESPGCVETDGDLTLNGTYEFEIDNNTACTGYDQLDVTGAVDVTGATLGLSLLDGYGFNEDDEFILINNDGSDEVTGEFTGLTEGDEIEVDGNTFVLSYEGGDGNDVSVLAASVSSENAGSAAEADAPDAPDTGVSSLISNPLAPFLSALLSLGAVVGVRKLNKANK